MTIVTHRPPALRMRQTTKRPADPPIADPADPTYQEVYAMLSEAAHLLTQAGRQLRGAQQMRTGFAVQDIADEVHAHIRNLPAPARHQAPGTPAQSRRRFQRPDS